MPDDLDRFVPHTQEEEEEFCLLSEFDLEEDLLWSDAAAEEDLLADLHNSSSMIDGSMDMTRYDGEMLEDIQEEMCSHADPLTKFESECPEDDTILFEETIQQHPVEEMEMLFDS